MRKPDALRDFLTRTVPTIADNPERLHLFIDQGSVAATAKPGLSYEYRYRLNLILTDFAQDPDKLMVPLLLWVSQEQPQLLHGMGQGKAPFAFEVDILDDGKVDLDIKLELTEVAMVTAREGGGYNVEHPPEPVIPAMFDEVPWGTRLWQLFLKEDLIAQGNFPDGQDPVP